MKKLVLVGGIVTIASAGIAWYVLSGNDALPYETVTVQRRDVVEEVFVTGQVKPAQHVELAFEMNGKIVSVAADVGAEVKAGDLIATIDSSSIQAQIRAAAAHVQGTESVLREYEVALEAEQARLDELLAGTRPEEIAVAETKLSNAKLDVTSAQLQLAAAEKRAAEDLTNFYRSVPDLLASAYTKADDAVYKYADELFSKQIATKNELIFIVANQVNKANAENARTEAMAAVNRMASRMISLPVAHPELDGIMLETADDLGVVLSFLIQVNTALNDAYGLESATLSAYKANISTARTNIVATISDINKHIQSIAAQTALNESELAAARSSVTNAQNAVLIAEGELTLKKAGSTPEQIKAQQAKVQQSQVVLSSQQARVSQANAELAQLQAQLDNYALRSPLDGIITRQDGKLGQIAPNTPIVTIISKANFEITANVPEADIAKLSLQDPATLTLDAYADTIEFAAVVTAIDPAETTIEGVTTYKVTFQFAEEDPRVKSGMTADITVMTDRREGALVIPQRAAIRQNGRRYARVLRGHEVVETTITTGLVTSDGYVEVTQGLSAGDLVITSINQD